MTNLTDAIKAYAEASDLPIHDVTMEHWTWDPDDMLTLAQRWAPPDALDEDQYPYDQLTEET
jgi:hypothetical protein